MYSFVYTRFAKLSFGQQFRRLTKLTVDEEFLDLVIAELHELLDLAEGDLRLGLGQLHERQQLHLRLKPSQTDLSNGMALKVNSRTHCRSNNSVGRGCLNVISGGERESQLEVRLRHWAKFGTAF